MGHQKNFTLYFYLDSLDSILDLEQPPFGAKGVNAPVVLRAGEEHRWREEEKLKGERAFFFFFFLLSLFFSSPEREMKKLDGERTFLTTENFLSISNPRCVLFLRAFALLAQTANPPVHAAKKGPRARARSSAAAWKRASKGGRGGGKGEEMLRCRRLATQTKLWRRRLPLNLDLSLSPKKHNTAFSSPFPTKRPLPHEKHGRLRLRPQMRLRRRQER